MWILDYGVKRGMWILDYGVKRGLTDNNVLTAS